jgi:hypothetical protein
VYILNPDTIPKEKIYWCNGIIGNFLIFEKHFPLLTKKGRMFGFAKTDSLEKAILELPFYLRVTRCF